MAYSTLLNNTSWFNMFVTEDEDKAEDWLRHKRIDSNSSFMFHSISDWFLLSSSPTIGFMELTRYLNNLRLKYRS